MSTYPTSLEALLRDACRRAMAHGLSFTNQIRLYRSIIALAREVRLRIGGHKLDIDNGALSALLATVCEHASEVGLDPDLPLPDAILVQRLAVMRAVNPAFIPRNHQVEAALNAAIERDDYAPFDDQPGFARYAAPPTAPERVHQTFCGT